jgi:hypothetical protein
MIKTISERIKEIQPNKAYREFLVKNIDTLQSSKEKSQDQSRLLTLQLFLLFFAFELLTRAAVSEVSIGYFKISDLTLVIKILPVIICYTYYELISMGSLRRLKSIMLFELIQSELKPPKNDDLAPIMFFGTSYEAEELIARNIEGKTSIIVESLTLPLKLAIILGPILFIIYAYYRIFATYGFGDILSWIFLPVSLSFLPEGLIIFGQTGNFD